MHVLNGFHDTPATLGGAVLAIGNFDGVHRGHQALLARARDRGREQGRPAGVMVFEPHPRALFRPDEPFFRLTTIERKTALFERFGLDLMVVIPFDRNLAALDAEAFIEGVLIKGLRVGGVVVGYDFQFGKARGGTTETLFRAGRALKFTVDVVEPVAAEPPGTGAYSSSAVRAALADGDIEGASMILGHRWTVEGTVVGGAKLGTGFGFPTANLDLAPGTRLGHGIYAVRVRANGHWFDGAGYYGGRPTVDGGAARLEVFLFGFTGNLYDRQIVVEFAAFIRGDRKFDTFDALKTQMAIDCERAASILAGLRANDPLAGLPLADSLA